MNKSIRYILIALLIGAIPAVADTMSFSPASQTVQQGSSVSVDILINGLGNGGPPALSAFDLSIFFDPAILVPTTVSFTNRLGDIGDPLQVLSLNQFIFLSTNIIGVELVELSFLSPSQLYALQATANAGFAVATVAFDTVGVGTTALTASFGSASDENGDSLDIVAGNGSVTVNGNSASTVPEPGSVLLLGSVVVLVARRMKQRR